MSKYKRYYYDSNVFSGSADLFRTAIKEYLFIKDSDDGSNQYVEGSYPDQGPRATITATRKPLSILLAMEF